MKVAIELPEMTDFMQAVFDRLDTLENKIAQLQGEKEGKLFYSVTEVASKLNVSVSKVRTLFYDGVLEGKKDGTRKKIIISRQSVERYEQGAKKIPMPKLKFA